MWRAKPFSSKQVALFPTLCRKQGAHLPRYRLFSGSGFHDFAAPNFSTGGYGSFSWLQVHLPLQLVTEWQSIFSSMAEHFPFRCGTAGLSLNWNELAVDRSPDVPRFIGMLLKRYPGLNTGTPQELCDQGLPPVNWVTLLGPSAHYVRR